MRLIFTIFVASILAIGRASAVDMGPQIEVLAQVVEFETAVVEARARAQLGTPLTAADLQEMMLEGNGNLIHSLRTVVRNGSVAVARATEECRFPRKFTVHRSKTVRDANSEVENVKVIPIAFDSEPIGPSLDVTCRLNREQSRVAIEFMFKCLSGPTWQEHEVECIQDGREPVVVSFERPTFHKREVQTKLDMGFGTMRVVGGGMPDRTGDKTAFLLLTCYLVDEHGSPVRNCAFGLRRKRDNWSYDGVFHRLVNEADRIVIRDGGYDCCIPTDGQKSLVVIRGEQAVREFNENLEFVEQQSPSYCFCCGYPGIDWYKGDRRLALTSVQHGTAIRWKGFPGDVALTKQSSKWLVQWLLDHGVSGQDKEFEKLQEKRKDEGKQDDPGDG